MSVQNTLNFREMRVKKLEEPTAQTKYGKIRGKRLVLANGFNCNAFLGVPYARPPLGDLRFKVIC
jgi:carboxylesterase type B